MNRTLDYVKHVFFEAMAAGWAQDVRKIVVPELPGSKAIPFTLGDFKVLDCYTVTPHSEKSFGQTTIWLIDEPIWMMQYGGWYRKGAIPFLKSCLHKAYVDERRFYAGRGAYMVQGEQFTYMNFVRQNDFANFSGEERIFDSNEDFCGYHWYRGMSLLEDEVGDNLSMIDSSHWPCYNSK